MKRYDLLIIGGGASGLAAAVKFMEEHWKGVKAMRPEGTYMLFVDCEEWLKEHNKTLDDVLNAAWDKGVAFQDGRPFHGENHIRVNLALPLSQVQEAFRRLDQYVFRGDQFIKGGTMHESRSKRG